MSDESALPYLRTPGMPQTRRPRRLAGRPPGGVELYHLGAGGGIVRADRDGVHRLSPEADQLRFIDEGQFAHHLVGDAATSPQRPSNATVELGVVRPRSAFTPHAHGGEHFDRSTGHAACGLYDPDRGTVTEIPLTPGLMIRIPETMPHPFANRGSVPLTILAANTGYGIDHIDHEDYAITAAEAERRSPGGRQTLSPEPVGAATAPGGRTPRPGAAPPGTGARTDYAALAAALRAIEHVQRHQGASGMTLPERLAAALRRAAVALEGGR